jgi:hypothetical protein
VVAYALTLGRDASLLTVVLIGLYDAHHVPHGLP